jgi:hypothetical protein
MERAKSSAWDGALQAAEDVRHTRCYFSKIRWGRWVVAKKKKNKILEESSFPANDLSGGGGGRSGDAPGEDLRLDVHARGHGDAVQVRQHGALLQSVLARPLHVFSVFLG